MLLSLSCLTLSSCAPAGYHAQQVQNSSEKLTLAKVQKEIKIGMSAAEVISQLGSPNIITTDDQRREHWVYDKIATDTVYSTSSGGIGALLLGFVDHGAIMPQTGYNQSSGARSVTQRTLTIVVKFDSDAKVRDFAYHNSSF